MTQLSFFSVSLAASLIVASVSFANEVKTFQIPFEAGQKIKIVGYKGIIDLVPANGEQQSTKISVQRLSPIPSHLSDEMRLGIGEFEPKVESRENVITISSKQPLNKDFWQSKESLDLIPQFKIQIVASSLPVEISWWKGQIETHNWKNSLTINLQDGDLDLTKNEGELRASVQSGTAKIIDHKGAVVLSSYDSKVVVKNIEGNVNVDNFTGTTTAEKIQGQVQLASFNGKNKVNDVKGGINFNMKVGSLDVDDLDGSLRGDNGDGNVKANVSGAPDVRIRSAAGGVNLRVSRKFSAHVNVGSVDGELHIPNHIKVQRGANMKWAVGRLQGPEKEGQIFARSQTGNIILNSKE